jgi:hypothetical protein
MLGPDNLSRPPVPLRRVVRTSRTGISCELACGHFRAVTHLPPGKDHWEVGDEAPCPLCTASGTARLPDDPSPKTQGMA